MARAYERDAWTYTGPARSSPLIRPGMSTLDWDYARRQQEEADRRLLELGGSQTLPNQRSGNQGGDWGNTPAPAADNSKPILGAIDRKLGGKEMPKQNDTWSNPPLPSNPPPSSAPSDSSDSSVDVGGDFVPVRPPRRPQSWTPYESRGKTMPSTTPSPAIGRPIVDIAPAPTPQTTTPAQTKVGGPSGFTEQYETPAIPMPSVDQLYKTYTDMAGENQGMRDYLASPQFQAIWQSGNIPYWMLSDPVWRNYLVRAGLLNWDAIARKMGRQ